MRISLVDIGMNTIHLYISSALHKLSLVTLAFLLKFYLLSVGSCKYKGYALMQWAPAQYVHVGLLYEQATQEDQTVVRLCECFC